MNVSNFGIDCQNTFLYIGIWKWKNFGFFSNLIFFSFLTPISRKLLDQSIQKFNTLEFKIESIYKQNFRTLALIVFEK